MPLCCRPLVMVCLCLHSPLIQFNLLHSKFHLCSVPTRALLLSAYIKFINLFPEIKPTIQDVLRSDSQLRNADVELQQRAVEYLRLSSIASNDILATVLEEMPPFPERESSILAKLKKKKGPNTVTDLEDTKKEKNSSDVNGGTEPAPVSTAPLPPMNVFEEHLVCTVRPRPLSLLTPLTPSSQYPHSAMSLPVPAVSFCEVL
ncbi:hypothetical protein GDO78_003825 [Eleutherodactylus coqui]|uniref:Clathrin/coatomer adaptor adaptin-like N-terminal domain-containing protein n=1 Tax=Eleutherodactylus coqui TaxID=57060 RepID=A0A8J6ETG7_ELECQ|nr:hypothetical protein GDO78_003825 [Eleutherodactylus coqui]